MAVNTCCAVLMDTVSIQKYVFASNTLRDNLGASHIVNRLFEDAAVISMADTLRPGLIIQEQLQTVRSRPSVLRLASTRSIPITMR